MPEKTPAQKRAQKAYMEKFARVEIRMTVEKQAAVKAHAESRGESVNTFIGRAIDEAMQRDGAAGETCIKESLFAGTTYAKCLEEKKDWQTVRVEVQEHEQPERVVKVFHVQPQEQPKPTVKVLHVPQREQPEPEKIILHYTPSEPVEVRPALKVVLHEDKKE